MISISILEAAGTFAENKDIARDLRNETIMPALANGGSITLDFNGVDGATQSFIHALISEPMRVYGVDLLERVQFKDCNLTIQKVITIVSEYMQEAAAET